MGLRGHKAVVSSGDQAIRFLVALIGPTLCAFPAQWLRGIITPAEAGSEGPVVWAHSSYEWTDPSARDRRTSATMRPASSSIASEDATADSRSTRNGRRGRRAGCSPPQVSQVG